MDGLISRQAAIEVIDAVMPVDPNKSEYASGIACGAALAMTYVKQLPSADRPQGWVDKAISIIDAMQKEGIIDYEQAWEFRMRARMKGADDEASD